MGEALLFSLIASSALVIGGAVGAYWRAPTQVTGVLLAFASGSLISALCFELFPEAYELGGAWRAGLGLLAGGTAFVVANTALDRWVAGSAKPDQREKVERGASGGVGWALLAAVTLDGVPENVALGVSLVEGASYTLLLAIFFSNLPESLVGAIAMRDEGRPPREAIVVWTLCALVLALAVILGRAVFAGADEGLLAVCLAFAGGAVLASLADTLMPEAFEHGRPFNSFATAAGFFLSFMVATV
jgi:ZIP family zinc transporter